MDIPFINKHLKLRRKGKGLTQEKTAELIFKSVPTIKRYDTGDIIPESVLRQFCDLLKIDFFLLLELQETENIKNSTSFYSELIEKYKNVNVVISPKIEPIILKSVKNNYDIQKLESELINYLKFKDDFLNIETTEENRKIKIEKIFSFIDFLYFQDIVKK